MKSQHVKLLNFCKTYDLNSVSYTSSSMPFQPFQKKKKEKCWSIKLYLLAMPMTMTLQLVSILLR